MNKNIVVLSTTLLLALGLMSACGSSNKADHSGHGAGQRQADADRSAGDNGGHSGHGGQAGAGGTNSADSADSTGRGSHSGSAGHNGHEGEQQAPVNLQAAFAFGADGAKASAPTELTVQITDKDGKPVNDFEVNHEKLLHLIVVNHDLSYFSHIHPEFKGDGKFTVDTAFPTGGEYKLIADFVPKGGSTTTLSEWVKVEGEEGEHVPIIPDTKLVKEVAGKEIELALSGTKPKEEVKLTFDIRNAKTKEGINDLQSYLGAVGHVVILSADADRYIHVHPLDEKATGPKAEFATSFPESGIYKIWGQFQHNGEVFTVPFVVDIE